MTTSEPAYPGKGAEWDMPEVLRLLRKQPWEDAEENVDTYGKERRLFLGTIFGLTPSGKFYAPFACSNVWGCDTCKGRGALDNFKRRVVKKRFAKRRRDMPAIYGGRHKSQVFTHRDRREYRHGQRLRVYLNADKATRHCTACGGLGSREAHLDEKWGEYSEALFSKHNIAIECRDGDYFAVEYSDDPESEESDDDEEA